MTSSASTDNMPPQPPPTLPPSSLRASSSTTLHDLLNFPSPNLDTPMPPPPSVPQHPAFQPGMEYYPVYHHPGMVQGHPLQMQGPPPPEYLHHPGAYGQPPPPFPHLASHPYASLPVGNPYEHMASSSKHRRDSIPSSITSMDDGADRGSTSRNTSQAPGEQMEVPPEIIAGLHGRQLTEKKRKWRAKQGVQGPGKSWRKGLKDSDRPPPPPPLPVPEPLVGHVEENRERHFLEPDWKSPLPPKKRKELTEKNRSRFVASAPAVKYNQAWITAEPLLNKGVEKTMPVRQWKIGNRMVRSITGKHWVSKSGWVGDTESPLATFIQERKVAAAQQAITASLPRPAIPSPSYPSPSPSGTPYPESSSLALPGQQALGAMRSGSPACAPSSGGFVMPHEKHRLYTLAREMEGSASREGSVASVGSDGTAT